MSKTALPTAADVTALLSTLQKPITLNGSYPTADVVNDAIAEFSRRTGWSPFFQSSATAVSVPFDPPGPNITGINRGGETKLGLKNGLISLTSVYNGVYGESNGNLLALGTDYWLKTTPDGSPPTQIEFVVPQWGPPQSIVVTGIWGYCNASTTIPNDAWRAILLLACSKIAEDSRESIVIRPTTLRDDDQSVTYGEVAKLGEIWSNSASKTIALYRRF